MYVDVELTDMQRSNKIDKVVVIRRSKVSDTMSTGKSKQRRRHNLKKSSGKERSGTSEKTTEK